MGKLTHQPMVTAEEWYAGRSFSPLSGCVSLQNMADDLQIDIEHLKLVQGIVARMASNSAQMKTWAVSLVTASFVFSGLSDEPHWLIGLGGCIPVISFWTMDAKYLHLERCYIKLYEAIVAGASVKSFELKLSTVCRYNRFSLEYCLVLVSLSILRCFAHNDACALGNSQYQ